MLRCEQGMARYELLERIGVGGMAEIFRGKATAGGGFEKPVAIKRILPHLSQDKRFVELLIAEAKTLSQLRHRNIVQIYDVGLGDDGQYFLVMEYVDGVDLNALLDSTDRRRRRLPLGVALYIAAEVCDALDHAHRVRGPGGESLRLVHRDVSPSNVLLSSSGEVKLTDFGIAKTMEEATGHGGVRGKFAYISPEQAHNRHVDGRSDVYSLGIVLYEMVTGQRLYSHLSDFDALSAVRDARRVRPRDADPSIDAELEDILTMALEPEPDQRFATAGQFASRLRACRYSIVSEVADPAKELAGVIAGRNRRPSQSQFGADTTFVRIDTVDGFRGFSFREESSGGGLEGEETLASSGTDLMAFDGPMREETSEFTVPVTDSPQHLDDAETKVVRAVAPARGGNEFDLTDAATSAAAYAVAESALASVDTTEQLSPGTERLLLAESTALHRAPAHEAPTTLEETADTEPPPGRAPVWMAPPTGEVRRPEPGAGTPPPQAGGGLFRGRPDGEPNAFPSPALAADSARELAVRRRTFMIVASVAAVVAIIAFAVAGALVSDGESSAQPAPALGDAGPVDGGAVMSFGGDGGGMYVGSDAAISAEDERRKQIRKKRRQNNLRKKRIERNKRKRNQRNQRKQRKPRRSPKDSK